MIVIYSRLAWLAHDWTWSLWKWAARGREMRRLQDWAYFSLRSCPLVKSLNMLRLCDAWSRIPWRPLQQVRCRRRHDHLLLAMLSRDLRPLHCHPLSVKLDAQLQVRGHRQRWEGLGLSRRFAAYEAYPEKSYTGDLGPLQWIARVCLTRSPAYPTPSGESLFSDRSCLLCAS